MSTVSVNFIYQLLSFRIRETSYQANALFGMTLVIASVGQVHDIGISVLKRSREHGLVLCYSICCQFVGLVATFAKTKAEKGLES